MRAMRFHDFGGPDTLAADDVPDPVAGAGEVLIDVVASSINPADWQVGAGWARAMFDVPMPFTPGMDFAGVIRKLGAGVTTCAVGDRVYGAQLIATSGAYAEIIAAPASVLTQAPKSLPLATAAAVPIAALTAWHALMGVEHADIQPGQSVLIHGGSGGTGMFAIQFARWRGAHVIATASARNQDFMRSLGADETIDYTATNFENVVSNVDAVIDLVGGDVPMRSIPLLRKGGVLTSIVPGPDLGDREKLAAQYGVRATFAHSSTLRDLDVLDRITRLIDDGEVKVIVTETFPLRQAAVALARSQSGRVRGKIVLTIGNSQRGHRPLVI